VALGKLKNPPIVEVVSGVRFEPLLHLDPLAAGAFWARRSSDFPDHELRPAVTSDGQIVLGLVPPLRAMLFHASKTRVLQLQGDRFYVNWRRPQGDTIEGARGGEYPRFNDRPGQPGLVTTVIDEYKLFESFCAELWGEPPKAVGIELAKVDLLIEGVDWTDFDDLASLLPWLRSFHAFARAPKPSFALRFDEPRDGGDLSVTISQAIGNDAEGKERRVVKVETRIARALSANTEKRDALLSANDDLNRVFEELIPKGEIEKRFNVEGK
jgi:hypothetical protein